MRSIALALLFVSSVASASPCAELDALIEKTYGFLPSSLDAAGRESKSAQMDVVWRMVHKNPSALRPCLKAALAKTNDDWFRFDGSQLLVAVDSSREAKLMLLDAFTKVPLDEVDLRTWVAAASSLGVEGFDTSALGRRWLQYPKAEYYLTEHAAYRVDRENGAMFLIGTLDERFATPLLIDLVQTSTGETKEIATWMLMSQATPEALQALSMMSTDGLSPAVIANRKALLQKPALIVPRPSPRTTRKNFVDAFRALLDGNDVPFDLLVERVPDGERDLVAVATAEDLDLLRRVRRHYIARNTPHAIEYYNQFSQILMTLVWKPELVGVR